MAGQAPSATTVLLHCLRTHLFFDCRVARPHLKPPSRARQGSHNIIFTNRALSFPCSNSYLHEPFTADRGAGRRLISFIKLHLVVREKLHHPRRGWLDNLCRRLSGHYRFR